MDKPRIAVVLPLLLLGLSMAGCRTPVPNLAGAWQVSATLQDSAKQPTATDILLTLVQTDALVHGDAALTMNHAKEAIHVPVANSVVAADGTVMLEGSAPQPLGTVLFRFEGSGKGGALTGTATITAQSFLGSEAIGGPLVFTRTK